MDTEKLKVLQQELSDKVIIPSKNGYFPKDGDLIFTFDIQYSGDIGYVAADIQAWNGTPLQIVVAAYQATVPYQPGYFAFREGPLLIQLLNDIKNNLQLSPDLIIIDGHGTAHPRRLGVASWVGVQVDIPTIGIAKEPLLKYNNKPQSATGSYSSIILNEEAVGFILRTQDGVKPIYVSAGHLVSQENTKAIAMALRSPYRIIEPIRRADQAARRFAKGDVRELVVL